MPGIEVDPSEVHSITVDPSEVSAFEHPSEAPKGFADQLGDFAGHTWEALKGTVTGPVHAALHPIDTVSNILQDAGAEVKKGKEAFDKGDYDRAAEHFKYALPVAGPLLRTMREETDAGNYGAALGDITGTVLGGKALGAIPKIPAGAAKVGAKALDVVPAAVGDTALQAGAGILSPRAKNIMIALDKMKKARAAYQEAGVPLPAPSATTLQRLGLTVEDFHSLPAEGQADVMDLEASMTTPRNTRPAPGPDYKPSVGTPELQAQIREGNSGKSVAQVLSDELAANRKPEPGPVPDTAGQHARMAAMIKGHKPPPGLIPVVTQEGEHVAYVQAPEPPPIQGLVDAAKGLMERKNPLQQSDTAGQTYFERGARAAKVPHFAQVLHDAGIPAEDMARAGGPEWELATERTNQVHDVTHGAPSPETRAAIIEQMRALEKAKGKPAPIVSAKPAEGALANNPKALKIARELAEALRE